VLCHCSVRVTAVILSHNNYYTICKINRCDRHPLNWGWSSDASRNFETGFPVHTLCHKGFPYIGVASYFCWGHCKLNSVVCHVYSVEDKKQISLLYCCYLLHKFTINHFFHYSMYFIWVTDCSIRVSWYLQGQASKITRGAAAHPCPPSWFLRLYPALTLFDH